MNVPSVLTLLDECTGLTIEVMASVTSGVENLSKAHNILRTCPNCHKITLHTTCDNICQQPNITIVCTNRFKQLPMGNFTKNCTVVHCDPSISLPNFVGSLVGVVLHHGSSITSGHYTSIVRADNIWYSCNDKVVSVINDIHSVLHSKDVYLLFYVKDNTY